jgi:hypothetical protein
VQLDGLHGGESDHPTKWNAEEGSQRRHYLLAKPNKLL